MNEVWKDIEGYEGIYQVSNLGRVRSLDRIDCYGRPHKGKIIKQGLWKSGYPNLSLHKDGSIINTSVHRLVAKAFVPGYFEGADVNHRDEDKMNNRADNLEWCTRSYNNTYGTGMDRRKLIISKPVVQMTLDGKFISNHQSIIDANRDTGIARASIRDCCSGKYKHAGGYRWRSKE